MPASVFSVEEGGCRRAGARLIVLTDLLLSRRAVCPAAALDSGNDCADREVMVLGLKQHFALLIGFRPERPFVDLEKRFCHWFGLCWGLRQTITVHAAKWLRIAANPCHRGIS
jgi:hypothetical protein